MPELPEVETIRQALLSNKIEGQVISNVKLTLPRILEGTNTNNFAKNLKHQKILSLRRRGKYLIFQLSQDSLIIHLGMTGQLSFFESLPQKSPGFDRSITGLERAKGPHPVDKHTHLHLLFSSGGHMLFRDVRTFGKIIFTHNDSWKAHPRIQKLGLEPLEHSSRELQKKISAHVGVRNIKSLLLDQHVIAGVGNIYCDEALFMAGILPDVPSGDLSLGQIARLAPSIQKVLKKGIKNYGTSISDYRKPDGSKGKNQERLMVYGRGGQPCRKCNSILIKIEVSQRGTVYCPLCQTN